MAEKYTKGDGSQTTNGDLPVVAPINMGLGLKYNAPTKRYDVAFGAKQPFQFNNAGEIEFKISNDKGNLIRQGSDNGIYYGIEAKANVANLYVDAENGVDQNPNDVEGAGTRAKPLRTLKYAMDLADNYTVRTIYLHEEQEHVVSATKQISVKPGTVSIVPYGAKFDKSQDGSRPDVPDTYQARIAAVRDRIAPSIVFKGVAEGKFPQATAPQRWNTYNYTAMRLYADCNVAIAGVNLVNDVTSTLTNTHPTNQDYNLIVSFNRIVNGGGSLQLDGVSFARRGTITVNGSDGAAMHLGTTANNGLWLTGMLQLLGNTPSSLIVRQVYHSENYEEHIIGANGWSVGLSTLNRLSLAHANPAWSAPRIFGVQKEIQTSGDVLVLAPAIDIPHKLFA